jgi:hypothetical protein
LREKVLAVVDVSPEEMELISRIDIDARAQFAYRDGYIYAPAINALVVIDVHDPTQPEVLDILDEPDVLFYDAEVSGDSSLRGSH